MATTGKPDDFPGGSGTGGTNVEGVGRSGGGAGTAQGDVGAGVTRPGSDAVVGGNTIPQGMGGSQGGDVVGGETGQTIDTWIAPLEKGSTKPGGGSSAP